MDNDYIGEGVKLSTITNDIKKAPKILAFTIAGVILIGGLTACVDKDYVKYNEKNPTVDTIEIDQTTIPPKIYTKTFAECAKAVDEFVSQTGEITELQASENGTIKVYSSYNQGDAEAIDVNVVDIPMPLKLNGEGDKFRVAVEYDIGNGANTAYISRNDIQSSTFKNNSNYFYTVSDGCVPDRIMSLKDRNTDVDENSVPNFYVTQEQMDKFGKDDLMIRIKHIRDDSRDVNIVVKNNI